MPPRDPECWVFLSHIHEDEPVAKWLKQRIERDFLGQVGVYVSSEAPAGTEWFPYLQEHLRKSALLFALCSPVSVLRPWVHFEVGAALALDRVVVPVCHDGQDPGDLDDPFRQRFAVTLKDPRGMRKLYEQVVNEVGMQEGDWDFDAFAEQVPVPEPVAGQPDAAAATGVDPHEAIRRRLHESLTTKQPWRTVDRLADAAGVEDQENVLTVLRADPEVRFRRGRETGKLMAGLKSRVGP
jgi:TIR domain